MNGEDFALHDKDVSDVARKLGMVGNMYDFFTMYADVDGWEWDGELKDPSHECTNPLDQWIVSRLHQLVGEVETNMDRYDLPNAIKPILPFIEDASNWYVRRSRRRFWKSGDDADKAMAYRTLHYVLVRLSYVLAPFTPFLAEEMYQNLTGGESIHLQDWLPAGHVNELTLDRMAQTRRVIEFGLMLRVRKDDQTGEEQRKVRQPLARLSYSGDKLDEYHEEIIAEEVNIKKVIHDAREGQLWVEIEKKLTPELKREGLMREVVRHVQSARKGAGLNVDDRISLVLETTDGELESAINEHADTIKAETLADLLDKSGGRSHQVTVKVEGVELVVSLERV